MKVILKYAFSQAGIVVLCILYAVIGAEMYMSMEGPLEDQQKQLKKNAALVNKDEMRTSFYLISISRTSLIPLTILLTVSGDSCTASTQTRDSMKQHFRKR